MAALSPSIVKVLTPITSPPFFWSFLLSACRSFSSPTHGLHVVNQKFTTVTLFFAKSFLLSTALPSRSFPLKPGKLIALLFSVLLSSLLSDVLMPASLASTLSPEPGFVPQSGYFCSKTVSLPSIFLISSAPSFNVFNSSFENWSFAPSIVLRRKSP